jgi:hypothetical protein
VRDIRYEILELEALAHYLSQGIIPDKSTLDRYIHGQVKATNKPFFQYVPIERYSPSDPEVLEQEFLQIIRDIRMLYQVLIDLNVRQQSLDRYYEVEKGRLAVILKKAEERAAMIEESIAMNNWTDGDTFADLTKVDLAGDLSRYIYPTTAFVDLGVSEVRLPATSLASSVLSLTEADITVASSNPADTVIIEGIEAFKTGLQPLFITVESQDQALELTLTVKFPTSHNTSYGTFEIDTSSRVEASFSPTDNPAEVISGTIRWDFDAAERQEFSLIIKKSEPDESHPPQYTHRIAIREASIGLIIYEPEAVFTSKPYPVSMNQSAIKLKTEDYTPAQTGLRYFVSYAADSTSPVVWREIENNQEISFRTVSEVINQEVYLTGQSPDPFMSHNNVDYYEICTTTNTPLLKSLKVYAGESMWLLERFEAGLLTTPRPEMIEHTMLSMPEFIKMGGISLTSESPEAVRLSSSVRVTTPTTVEFAPVFEQTEPHEENSFRIYLNRQPINPVTGVYRLDLIQGLNIVEVFWLARTGSVAFTTSLNLKDSGGEVYAIPDPLTVVSLDELLNNTPAVNRTRCAVTDDHRIIVNYDPYEGPMAYSLTYKYLPFGGSDGTIRLMALLSRKNIRTATPKIKSYKLELR